MTPLAHADDRFAPPDPAPGGAAAGSGETAAPYDAARCDDFTVPVVRDLCWLMRSPALLSRGAFGEQLATPFDTGSFGPDAPARLHAVLARLDADPTPLFDALAAAPERRLGRYAERLLAVWLRQMPDVSVVALNLAVREAKRTLGECDALFRTAPGRLEHWEMAVKFYLRIDPLRGTRDEPIAPVESVGAATDDAALGRFAGCDAYVGVGLADRLDWKLRHLVEHQLPLSQRAELVALGGGAWQARMFVKGRLFHPLAQWRNTSADGAGGIADDKLHDVRPAMSDSAPALAPDHLRGWWATYDEWCAASAGSACRWTTLARLDGLAPQRIDPARAWSASAFARQLATRFASGAPGDDAQRTVAWPVPVVALPPGMAPDPAVDAGTVRDADGSVYGGAAVRDAHDAIGELSRGFIVPNDWPTRARRFRRTGQRHHQ
ncbi:DUF1853 family protein [Robbsia sp. Bb-Pol-6]|uniref:DUF1853 family protein n=1 Tax=Robbsia betulipollinis TaxID=2981849 RepID=A0ABT3ZIH1_9BURK|nr:DUF1853 family protein [Robbsia betulipollinis]